MQVSDMNPAIPLPTHEAERMVAKAMVHQVPGVARDIAASEAQRAISDRQAREDVRANHRNRNRVLGLVVTLMAELLFPVLLLPYIPIPVTMKSQAMIVLITLPDTLITAYAYLRRY